MTNNLAVAMPVDDSIAQEQRSPEEEMAALRKRAADLDKIAEELTQKLDVASRWRLKYEQRMIDSERQFRHGLAVIPEVKENNQSPKEVHRRSPDNITRSKTLSIVARRQDMLFSSRNWELRASPMATLHPMAEAMVAQLQSEGAPQNVLSAFRQEIAQKRAKRMEQIIADRLSESNYDQHGRAVVLDSCKLGTGVLEGPFVKVRARKRMDFTTKSFVVEHVTTQAVERVDPLCFFPQPCRHIREAEHAFRLYILTKSDLQSMLSLPGFDPIQSARLLHKTPDFNALQNNFVMIGSNGQPDPEALKDRYPVFKYRGPVPRAMLEMMASDERTTKFLANMPEEQLPVVLGEVWMSMGILLKAVLDPMEQFATLGYRVVNYEKDPDSCFGYSVPNIIVHDQDAAHVAWSAALANAMASAKPMAGIRKESLVSEDGNYDLLGGKPWVLKGIDDIRKAVSFQTVPNTTGPTLEIYDRAKRNAGEHLLLPEAAQGVAASSTPQTASGLAMLMNAGNVVQRYAANEWDDEITVGLIRDMVDYEMLWGTDEEAKGDYDPVPLASTHLLVKDVRLQQSLAVLQMADNPKIARRIREEKVVESILRDMEVPADQFLRTEEEVQAIAEQEQPPPSDAQIKADADLQRAQMEMQTRIEEAAARIDQETIRGEAAMQVAMINLRAMALKVASDEKVSMAEVMANFRITEIEAENRAIREAAQRQSKERLAVLSEMSKRMQIGASTQIEATKIAAKRESESRQMQVESPPRF